MKKYPKPTKGAWFVKVRGSYLPCSWQGWLTYIPYVGYLVVSMVVLIYYFGSRHWPLVIILYIPSAIAVATALQWVARNKS